MKRIILFLLGIGFCFSSAFADSGDYDSRFVTLDGKHMCWEFPWDTFYPCETVGIIYDTNDKVIRWKEPFFRHDGLAIVWGKTVCVDEGREVAHISDCNRTYTLFESSWAFDCTILDGVETCVPETNSVVIANGNCTLNSVPVDCAEVTKGMKNAFKIGIWIFLIWGILALVGFIFWIWTIIHALSNPIPNKVLWVLVLIVLGIVGSIIYYFVIIRKYKTVLLPNPQNLPYQMNVWLTYHEWPVWAPSWEV